MRCMLWEGILAMKQHFMLIGNFVQMLAAGTLAASALALLAVTALSAAGVLPWLELQVNFGTPLPLAGIGVQIGTTLLLLVLASYIPASYRVAQLEMAHRNFEVGMDDVTRAYRAAHMADRAETFEIRREFDAVRQRYKFLKDQPDLKDIDDELLVIAAQMSETSRDLADRFSDRRIARVREGLERRAEDAQSLESQVRAIRNEKDKLTKMRGEAEVSESEFRRQVDALQDEFVSLTQLKDVKDGTRH